MGTATAVWTAAAKMDIGGVRTKEEVVGTTPTSRVRRRLRGKRKHHDSGGGDGDVEPPTSFPKRELAGGAAARVEGDIACGGRELAEIFGPITKGKASEALREARRGDALPGGEERLRPYGEMNTLKSTTSSSSRAGCGAAGTAAAGIGACSAADRPSSQPRAEA